jgi:hypothetical protein
VRQTFFTFDPEMNYNTLSRFLLLTMAAFILPLMVSAKASPGLIAELPVLTSASLPDSVIKKQPAQQDDKKQDDKKQDPKKADVKRPDIKEVPKAKRQIKPVAVKTRVKIPVKRVKPVIKRRVGSIRINLGL